jgi:hypothetical protein
MCRLLGAVATNFHAAPAACVPARVVRKQKCARWAVAGPECEKSSRVKTFVSSSPIGCSKDSGERQRRKDSTVRHELSASWRAISFRYTTLPGAHGLGRKPGDQQPRQAAVRQAHSRRGQRRQGEGASITRRIKAVFPANRRALPLITSLGSSL